MARRAVKVKDVPYITQGRLVDSLEALGGFGGDADADAEGGHEFELFGRRTADGNDCGKIERRISEVDNYSGQEPLDDKIH